MSTVRERIVRGLVAGLVHEAFIVIVSFTAMLVLVRLLTPRDYGEAAVVSGILALARAFSGAMFVEHALQHGKETEPDWDRYFAVVGLVQLTLFTLTNLAAVTLRFTETMASVSPLLHVASLGLLLEWPAQVASVKLRRELRFERLRIISGAAVVAHLGTAIVLASLGLGATALIVGGNVLSAAPMAITFLVIDGWRPRRTWVFVPSASERAPIVAFAGQQIAGSLLQSVRSAAESVLLTQTFGVTTFGLVNRALALYQSTIGRVGAVFLDTAYPVLPMESHDPRRYAQRASRFIEATLILGIPAAVFIVMEGAHVSRLLYGTKWAAADPFLAPAAVALAAGTLTSAASYVLLGINRVTQSVVVEALVAGAGLVALGATFVTNVPTQYLWTLAAAQAVSAIAGFTMATPFIARAWWTRGLWPAVAASGAGAMAITALRSVLGADGVVNLLATGAMFALVACLTLAITARSVILEVLHTQRAFSWRPQLATQSEAKA